jgi:CRISPR-associated endonuclease/helicase Cas3
MTKYFKWFSSVTSKAPFPYQERLAVAEELPILLDVPTGAGKTASVVLGWLWRRLYAEDEIKKQTPRRLVYCLPMRTLVEQTYAEVESWLAKAGLTDKVELHLLMGGAVSRHWDAHPEKNCILIGTQDQLLSRALNRGYSMSRYRWPIHFALLNNDCLWVMDEVQLMGAGLKTTTQLQGFREYFSTYGPVRSLWMSATLDATLLETVDYEPDFSKAHQLKDADRVHPILQQRIQSKKPLVKAQTAFDGKEDIYAKALAAEVDKVHIPGTLTLVICNRVSRAQAVYKALQKITKQELLPLIHSRFRATERKHRQDVLNLVRSGQRFGILVATQAIEAGVDISANVLFTELAPWSSLVQRFGRCNRYGECSSTATVYWIDIADLKKKEVASPYEVEQLEEARRLLLGSLTDVGLVSLEQVKAFPQDVEGLIPRKHDLLQLFDTSTDLAGHDIDISPFIRETDDTDVAMAWRSWEGKTPSSDMSALQQPELCRVSVFRAKELLDKLRKLHQYAWVWDGLQGFWAEVRGIYPGMSLLLNCASGGYSTDLGFTGDTNDKPSDVSGESIEPDQDDADPLTYQAGQYVTLVQHSQDVADQVRQLCSHLSEYDLPSTDLLERTGRWHDLGKAHAAFQEMLTRDRADKSENGPWAKSDQKTQMRKERRGFRHELVSALVALQQGEPFLLTYLVAAHHGKVRMAIQPRPGEKAPTYVKRYALGVWDGVDCLLPVDLGDGVVSQEQVLSLACMELGEGESGESWTAQAIALLEEYGPFKLAFLESLIRIADWQASTNAEKTD